MMETNATPLSPASGPALLVLTSFPDPETARQIGTTLVEKQLAACVHLLPPVTSIYRWRGQLETASETPAFLKTTRSAFPRLRETLLALHPYEVPEVLALDISDGAPAYLAWLHTEVP